MSLSSLDVLILRYLRRRPSGATAAQISAACAMAPSAVRERLQELERLGLVADDGTSRRVFHVTGEGRRRAGVSDARRTGP